MIQQIDWSYDNDFYCYCSVAEELHGILKQFKNNEQLLEYKKLLKKHADTVRILDHGMERFEKAKELCRDYINQNGGKLMEEISRELCVARLTLFSACMPMLPQNLAWLLNMSPLCKSVRFCACQEKKVALQFEMDYFYPQEQPIALAMDELQKIAPPAPDN